MLKNYQQEAINSLTQFCNNIDESSINQSFKDIINNQYLEVDNFSNPYVCIRIPTGGGKTLIATKSIRVITQNYLNKDYSLVLWLAPSDKIVSQTLEVLKNKQHSYRQILDKEFDNIEILSIQEAFKKSFNPKESLVIIVGTIQSFRTTNKDGRKFFDENSTYYEMLKSLDMKPSLENMIKYFKPIVILDEAHKSSTALSLKSLLDIEPSFILELTATPITKTIKAKEIYASNILYSVNATELKKENMIKLPIMLKTIDDSLKILKEGIEKREYLEKLSILEEGQSSRYIRPINLIRADENRGSEYLTYDKIKTILIEEFKIDEKQIAIQTGDKKEIDGVDLFSPDCPIRYIITVDALKEGWDCSFAYVLSVVSNMQSATAIEQLIGRVLRMPYIESKNKKELEKSYVYVASSSFEDVAQNIGKTLVDSGFEDMEAKISIDISSNTNQNIVLGGLFQDNLYEDRQIQLENMDLEEFMKPSIEPYININTDTNILTITNFPSSSKREKLFEDLKKVVPQNIHHKLDEIKENINSSKSEFIEKTSDIEIPILQIEYQGENYDFEDSLINEFIDISESEIIKNSKLSIDEFDIKLNENLGLIDIKQNKIIKQKLEKKDDILPIFEEENENERNLINSHKIDYNLENRQNLVHNISKLLREEDENIFRIFDSTEIKSFISLVITDLINNRENIDLTLLISKKYNLKKAILNKLKSMIENSKTLSFRKLFNEGKFNFVMSNNIYFSSNNYFPIPDDRSGIFKKHKYKYVHKFDSDEEYKVALYIDSLENVSIWIRNVDRDYKNSFWLETEKGKFYPDFIIKFKNGKIAVAEYKGKVYIPEYEKTKKSVGDAWGSVDENFTFLSLYENNFREILNR
ncbi:DEAD/DEAH box helicase [Aliarcobacter vitoriensis]|uniref:DEAD/DEAH box helicase n=2 Tax=Aliarcobacter TaxID=2321111 RepID=UPI003AABCD22